VENEAGECLGHVEDLVIDDVSGRIKYAVLALSGIRNESPTLVPWGALQLDWKTKVFLLTTDKETLKRMPIVDGKHWPDMSNWD
jgi:hypothetical protein